MIRVSTSSRVIVGPACWVTKLTACWAVIEAVVGKAKGVAATVAPGYVVIRLPSSRPSRSPSTQLSAP